MRAIYLGAVFIAAFSAACLLLEGPLRGLVPSCPVSFGFCLGPG